MRVGHTESEGRWKTLAAVINVPGSLTASVANWTTTLVASAGIVFFVLSAIGITAVPEGLLLVVVSTIALDITVQTARRERLLEVSENLAEKTKQLLGNSGTLRQLPAATVGAELAKQLDSADQWFFRGGSASWIRGEALPTLARNVDKQVSFHAILLDPREVAACSAYANYRYQSRQDVPVQTPGRRDPTEIQAAVLATLYDLAWHQHHSRIRPSVALTSHYSPIRIDGSNHAFVLTVADLRDPALLAESGTWLHSAIKDELLAPFEGGHPLVHLDGNSSAFPESRDEVTAEMIRNAVVEFNLETPDGLQIDNFLKELPFDNWDRVHELAGGGIR